MTSRFGHSPHTNEVMKNLHEQGIQIGVVTTKIRMSTERGMKFCGLYDYVDAFVTVDDVTNPKPHPEPVLMALGDLALIRQPRL